MAANEKIIVFKAYDTVIKANLAKTKLDAYGIPCFLTEENFTSLYPLQNDMFPGVRLHIFERDIEEVTRILTEQSGTFIICPHCQSKDWKKVPKATGKFTFIALFALLGMRAPLIDDEYQCNRCGRTFA